MNLRPAGAVASRQFRAFDSLLQLAARTSGEQWDRVESLGWALAGGDAEDSVEQRGGASELNNDGFPLQLCLSASRHGVASRIIADPAWWMGEPEERLRATRASLAGALNRCGASDLRHWCDRLFDLIPQDRVSRFERGFIWIGAELGAPGIAVYLDAQPLGSEAWDRAQDWLYSMLPASPARARSVDALREYADLASIGFEGVSENRVRAKLYWRLRRAVSLAHTGIDLLSSSSVSRFLREVVGAQRMNLSGTVFCSSFNAATGEMDGIKLDLCGHCLPKPGSEWVGLLRSLSSCFDVAQAPIENVLSSEEFTVAFVGLGLQRSEEARINVYVRPTFSFTPEGCVERAIEYLVGLQRMDGSFHDYNLPVGRATQWVTAFTGLALAMISPRYPEARHCAERAARWLQEHRSYAAGWGYNDVTGDDTDSTALALRLFRALGYPVEKRDEGRILERWRPGGGFATYDEPGHWADPHPCVTVVAFAALNRGAQRDRLESLREYIERTFLAGGEWPAYWWKNNLYSAFHFLLLMRELGWEARMAPPRLPADASCFELAYAAGIRRLSGAPDLNTEQQLFAKQRFDGGWPGAANLRVTDPACERPWENARGALYADRFGTITTASVLWIAREILEEHK